jgi:hypothetical protein
MMNYSKNSLDYIRVQLMVAAMESLLTIEQGKRILRAAECGGFDAAMKSLARVSDQIVMAQRIAAYEAAYNKGLIISLQRQVQMEKDHAETTQRIYEAALVATSA